MNSEPSSKPAVRWFSIRNWITLSGLVVALGAIFSFLLLLTIDYFSPDENPYEGILTYLVAPGFLIFGLLLMIIGWLRQRRRVLRAALGLPAPALVIDLGPPRDRRRLVIFLSLSLIFFLASAVGSYRTYHLTKSVQFCGQTCHTVMEPQYVAYQNSPHARVGCTECHVAPGAAGFVRAKMGGLYQVYATLFNKYECPISGHGRTRINQGTCEQCHWPKKYVGNLDRTYTHFLSDETNTPYSVRLLLKVGGGDPTHGPMGGIHWHMNIANKIEYVATDELRQKIPWVRLTDAGGVVTEFRVPDFKDDPAKYKIRTMDCIDCHNRPAHHFRAPNDAVDVAMSQGKIDPALPGIKKEAVLALTKPYATKQEGREKIAATLREKYPRGRQIDPTIAAVVEIYENNFFPEMKTNWKQHPNNIGHKDWAGCFRCHDGEHASADRKLKIKAGDCNTCHTILAEGRGPQFEQLSAQGLQFKHPEEGWEALNCYDCHNGTIDK